MKFCNQCGAKLEDDMAFCNVCGAKQPELVMATVAAEAETAFEAELTEAAAEVSEGVENVVQETAGVVAEVNEAAQKAEWSDIEPEAEPVILPDPNPNGKKSKGPLLAIIAAVVVVLAAAGLLLFFALRKETISADKLVRIVGYGPDGFGNVAVMLGDEKVMSDIINADDDENEYPGLWKYLYNYVTVDDEEYPDGISTWLSENETEYFAGSKAWKKLGDKKISEARKALKKNVEISVENDKSGKYKVGDTITVTVTADAEALKKAHVILKNTTFEYTFTEDDFAECTAVNPFKGFVVTCEGFEGAPKITPDFTSIDSTAKKLFYHTTDYESMEAAKKNGDKVIFTATFLGDASKEYYFADNEHKYYSWKKKDLTYEYTLNGLEELKEIDAFEGISFVYKDYSPNLSIEIDPENLPEICQRYCLYELDKSYGLKVGDQVVVTVKNYFPDSFTQQGYFLDETKQYTFTIPAEAPHLLTDGNFEYDPEQYFALHKQFDECVGTAKIVGNLDCGKNVNSIDAFAYTKGVLYMIEDESGETTNVLYQLAEITINYTNTSDVDTVVTMYYLCKCPEAYLNADGKLSAPSTTYSITLHNDKDAILQCFDEMAESDGVKDVITLKE